MFEFVEQAKHCAEFCVAQTTTIFIINNFKSVTFKLIILFVKEEEQNKIYQKKQKPKTQIQTKIMAQMSTEQRIEEV